MTTNETLAEAYRESHCAKCGAEFSPNGCATGYGVTHMGERHCYACCAADDREAMTREGRATLYLKSTPEHGRGWAVTNWPGTLEIPVAFACTSKHNWGLKRRDVWFRGPDGAIWHGYNVGDNDIAHCKRTKRKSFA